ncbi:MAG: hypothetical protein RL557_236 [archaeon]
MKIFFVSPNERNLWETAGDRAPLGIGFLSNYCKKVLHIDTTIFDLNHDNEETLFDAMKEHNPSYICFGITSPSYLECLRLVRKIKETGYTGKIIAGGNHITDNPYEELTRAHYDYMIVGDGELALRDIFEGKARGQIIFGEKVDVNQIPWPDYEGLHFERYWMTLEGKKCAMIIGSRGCIYSCAFCGEAKTKKLRTRNAADVVSEMKFLMDNYKIEAFYFGDEIFTYERQRVFDICRLIRETLKPITFRMQTRVNLIDDEILDALKSSGCNVITLGLESGNDQILKNIQKGATVDQARKAVKMIHDKGMKVKGFFIIGLPGETIETAWDTINFAKEINIDFADFYPYTPFPSTPIWNNPERYGLKIIKPKDSDWNQYFMVGKDGMPQEWKIIHPNLDQKQVGELIAIAKSQLKSLEMSK